VAAVLIRPNASQKSRCGCSSCRPGALAVPDLFARLWYMQVLTGDGYRPQAAEQSVRDVVVQPAAG
jgi:penicillin-binding protein 2